MNELITNKNAGRQECIVYSRVVSAGLPQREIII